MAEDPRAPFQKAAIQGKQAAARAQVSDDARTGHAQSVSRREDDREALLEGPLGDAYRICICAAADHAILRRRADSFPYLEIKENDEIRNQINVAFGEQFKFEQFVSKGGRGILYHALSRMRSEDTDFTMRSPSHINISVEKMLEYCRLCGVEPPSVLEKARKETLKILESEKGK